MKWYHLILSISVLALAQSCTLSADQEAALNQATVQYINARNDGEIIAYVAFTHPAVVSYYTNQGDSIFKRRFDLPNDDFGAFLQDGNIKVIETKGSSIHVKYSFLAIDDPYYDLSGSEEFIYAISDDNGVSWFYTEESDYLNNHVFPKEKRLIK